MRPFKYELQKKESLIKLIENSIDSHQFRSLIVKDPESGEVFDLYEDGELSCAFYVSSLLHQIQLIDAPRARAESVEAFLNESDEWEEVTRGAKGDVVVWAPQATSSGEEHAHVGFLLDELTAVSSDDDCKCILEHPITYKNRMVTKIFRLKD